MVYEGLEYFKGKIWNIILMFWELFPLLTMGVDKIVEGKFDTLVFFTILCGMKEKYIRPKFENVKVRTEILDRVRQNKIDTRVPIIVFVETAIEEKLFKTSKTKKP